MHSMRVALAAAAMTAALAATPAGAAAQTGFPLYGKDKFLGNANDFTTSVFPRLFNQLIPENAGKWGSAAGTTRTAAMRWNALDQAYNFAKANNTVFNFHILLWGNQQPTWMVNLPPEEQLAEIKKWFAAVAARYPNIDVLQVVNEGTWDSAGRVDAQERGRELLLQRQLCPGTRRLQRHRRHGL